MLGVSNHVTKDYLANWIVLLVMNNIMQKGRPSTAICPLMSARNTLALQIASQDVAKIFKIKSGWEINRRAAFQAFQSSNTSQI